MKHFLPLALLLCISLKFSAQTQTFNIDSKILNSTESIIVKLIEGCKKQSKVKYPVAVVLNNDYSFKTVVGEINFINHSQGLSNPIAVGISKASISKYLNLTDDEIIDELSKHRLNAYISNELLQYLEKYLNVNDIRTIIADRRLVNFSNTFAFSETPVSGAYSNLNPEFNPKEGTKKKFLNMLCIS